MTKKMCLLILSGILAVPAFAQISTGQLQAFRAEANAFNQHDPFSNAFRAGHYNGYLAGLVEALQNRSVCFKACPCELDTLVGAHLEAHPEALEQPAATWLVPLLEASYPCQRAESTSAGSGLLNK